MADPTEFADPRLVAVYDTLNAYAQSESPETGRGFESLRFRSGPTHRVVLRPDD